MSNQARLVGLAVVLGAFGLGAAAHAATPSSAKAARAAVVQPKSYWKYSTRTPSLEEATKAFVHDAAYYGYSVTAAAKRAVPAALERLAAARGGQLRMPHSTDLLNAASFRLDKIGGGGAITAGDIKGAIDSLPPGP